MYPTSTFFLISYFQYILITSLFLADVEKEKKLYNQWITRCEDWKSLKLAKAIAKHK